MLKAAQSLNLKLTGKMCSVTKILIDVPYNIIYVGIVDPKNTLKSRVPDC